MSGLRSQLRLRILLPTALLALAGVGVSAFAFGGSPPVQGADPLPGAARASAGTTTEKAAPAPEGSLATWAKEANGLCRTTLEKVEELDEPRGPEELTATLSTTLELGTQLAAGLEALPRPEARANDIARLVSRAERANAALQRALAIGVAPATVAAFADRMDETHAAGERFDALARRLGARVCAIDSTRPRSPLENALLRDKVVVVVLHAKKAPVDTLAIREARNGASTAKTGFLAVDVGGDEDLAEIAKAYDIRKAPAVLVMRRWVGAVSRFGGWIDATTVAQAARNAKA